MADLDEGAAIACKVEDFVRDVVIPYETDGRRDDHGPLDALVQEMRAKAREAGVLTPHIRGDGTHLSHRATARELRASPDTRHAVLVALTGWGAKDDRARSREAGFDHHLTKPAGLAAVDGLLAQMGAARAKPDPVSAP